MGRVNAEGARQGASVHEGRAEDIPLIRSIGPAGWDEGGLA
jgi:hypothetical protein